MARCCDEDRGMKQIALPLTEPTSQECSDDATIGIALEIQLHACPLKEAWQEAGLAPEEMATLCRIAGAVDRGLFEAAGFRLENRTWTPGAEGCCFLRVLPG